MMICGTCVGFSLKLPEDSFCVCVCLRSGKGGTRKKERSIKERKMQECMNWGNNCMIETWETSEMWSENCSEIKSVTWKLCSFLKRFWRRDIRESDRWDICFWFEEGRLFGFFVFLYMHSASLYKEVVAEMTDSAAKEIPWPLSKLSIQNVRIEGACKTSSNIMFGFPLLLQVTVHIIHHCYRNGTASDTFHILFTF